MFFKYDVSTCNETIWDGEYAIKHSIRWGAFRSKYIQMHGNKKI